MVDIEDSIWVQHERKDTEIPLRQGVCRALSLALPPEERELPERMAKALQALKLALEAVGHS